MLQSKAYFVAWWQRIGNRMMLLPAISIFMFFPTFDPLYLAIFYLSLVGIGLFLVGNYIPYLTKPLAFAIL